MKKEEFKKEILNSIDDEEFKNKIEYYLNNKKFCYDCKHYYTSEFCGYSQSICDIVGSIDLDQNKYHPDVTADICKNYENKGNESVYEFVYSDLVEFPETKIVLGGFSAEERVITEREYCLEKIEKFHKRNKK